MTKIRHELIEALQREIIGPSPNHEYIDPTTNEEILLGRVHGSPQARYGAGLLYPKNVPQESIPENDSADSEQVNPTESETESELKNNGAMTEKGAGSDEEPVSLANQFKPSAMGFTARFKTNLEDDRITILVNSAKYVKGKGNKQIKTRNSQDAIENIVFKNKKYKSKTETPNESEFINFESEYWVRVPINIDPFEIKLRELFKGKRKVEEKILLAKNDKPWLKFSIFNRTSDDDKKLGLLTLTFSLVNEMIATTDFKKNNDNILFQNELKITAGNFDLISPYRERIAATDTLEEDELALLYRYKQVYAIGHGCAVTWGNNTSNSKGVSEIITSVLPKYEMPQIAPTSPESVELNMYNLSDKGDWTAAIESLRNLVKEYGNWVTETIRYAKHSPEMQTYREAAISNSQKCATALQRIDKGVKLLENEYEDSDLVKAFRWMNRAMIWQQQRSKTPVRKWKRIGSGSNIDYKLEGLYGDNSQTFHSLYDYQLDSRKGRWRPFQLAFVLMNIESIINPDSEEREIVDLIWFPTGGGKTEAYLGLTAFTIFYRRLKCKDPFSFDEYGGTTAIMRYTLRLLTTQQYERASSLIVGCDLIRQDHKNNLGMDPISIGLWVGSKSTPNDNINARSQYKQLIEKNKAEYNFIVMKCPCCGAQIGKLDQPHGKNKIKGLKKEDGTSGKILFHCENPFCEYADTLLPLIVVDEYIYEDPPTLLLGTVDKFAMITWKEKAGKLFGFRYANGSWYRILPPELIIQDELHLISGPLGTMVGLYETMIHTLCNNYKITAPPFLSDEKSMNYIPPKIVASSATISRAYEQVKSLYAIDSRNKLNIFPAQGLSFGDTWFSEEKEITEKTPGRLYVGILAPGYPSMQTAIVRAYAAILQKVGELGKESVIDYYWTLLGYFNSIRELGGANSLVYSDIRERLSQLHNRELTISGLKRFIKRNEELTSRMSSFQIPEILKKLESNYNISNNTALDICLATNMVATGVDISRLGLMFIHGQPKTTAEYIQASSRVGRELPQGPGLIFTLYSPSKPRDKSQYEQFHSYHNRLYSKVEPTSVTPFSISTRQRALHAILIGLIRHFSSGSMRDRATIDENEFEELSNIIKQIILKRCNIVDPDERLFTESLIDEKISFWKRGFQKYGDAGNNEILKDSSFFPLMYANGIEIREGIEKRSLPTPTNMRGVDSESRVSII